MQAPKVDLDRNPARSQDTALQPDASRRDVVPYQTEAPSALHMVESELIQTASLVEKGLAGSAWMPCPCSPLPKPFVSFLPLCYHFPMPLAFHQPHIFTRPVFPIGSTTVCLLQSRLSWVQHMPGAILSGPPPPAGSVCGSAVTSTSWANRPTFHTK